MRKLFSTPRRARIRLEAAGDTGDARCATACTRRAQGTRHKTVNKCMSDTPAHAQRECLMHAARVKTCASGLRVESGWYRASYISGILYTLLQLRANEPSFKWHSNVHWTTLHSNIFARAEHYMHICMYMMLRCRKYTMALVKRIGPQGESSATRRFGSNCWEKCVCVWSVMLKLSVCSQIRQPVAPRASCRLLSC